MGFAAARRAVIERGSELQCAPASAGVYSARLFLSSKGARGARSAFEGVVGAHGAVAGEGCHP
eukprot:10608758-Lingulodinium_polyedra.AAC.1